MKKVVSETVRSAVPLVAVASAAALLVAAYGADNAAASPPAQLARATPGALRSCVELVRIFQYPNTTISGASEVSAGTLSVAGKSVPRHCVVTGEMNRRTSLVDGQSYAIGFEMRLPAEWNGRFFHQANGGSRGVVVQAAGGIGGGGPLDNALRQGFAVVSSDVGHDPTQSASFGIDPRARLDNGYTATEALTPMSKALIKTAYGKVPDRSYIGGCSNGGRHALVAAARFSEQYDGFLVGNPGIRLPLAGVANLKGAQTYASLGAGPDALRTCDAADGQVDGKVQDVKACQAVLESGFTPAERTLVVRAVLNTCDALDGVVDGMVQDTAACQAAFNLQRDVPACSGPRDGTCLSATQKSAIAGLFGGPATNGGRKIYASFPYDAGIDAPDWADWKFSAPLTRDSGSVGILFSVPPQRVAGFDGSVFALTADINQMFDRVHATDATYTEAAMTFMPPPDATDLGAVRQRGGKIIVYHGIADPIFSSDDTNTWYEGLRKARGGDASDFARYYRVPGMNHCSGGPSTDQFDMLTPLVQWVEEGRVPERVVAFARGPGNAGAVNRDVPSSWASNRSRPLCPYPTVARYKGGDLERADSFACE